jgi:hypothetical protein
MIPMDVKICMKDDINPVWTGICQLVDHGILKHVAILEGGMESGRPSVSFRIDLIDGSGTSILVQQTARQMVLLARIIEAKFPDVMED